MIRPKSKFFLIILIIFLSFVSCSENNYQPTTILKKYPIDSLSTLIMNRLNSSRIIMLGDAAHGHRYFFNKLTDFLNYWVINFEENSLKESLPRKLILFLEAENEFVEKLNDYINTGNYYSFLAYFVDYHLRQHLNNFTVDYLKFIYDLRKIALKINMINQGIQDSVKIELKIIGPENDSIFEYANIVDMPKQEFERKRHLYFVKERDKLSSQNIKQKLEDETEFKAIVFYGNAHLIRPKTDKSLVGPMNDFEPMEDYFLAHYLDDFFGRKNVCIFYSKYNNSPIEDYIVEYQENEYHPDYLLNYKLDSISRCPIFFIKSKLILNILIDELKKYHLHKSDTDYYYELLISKYLYNYLKRSYLNLEKSNSAAIDSIEFYAFQSKDLKTLSPNVIKIAQRMSYRFDAIKNIEAIDEWLFNFTLSDSISYISFLSRLRFDSPADTNDITSLEDLFDLKKELLLNKFPWISSLKNNKKLVEYYLVNLLWVGTPEEKVKVINFLQIQTEMKYQTVEEWDKWFFKNYTFNNSTGLFGG